MLQYEELRLKLENLLPQIKDLADSIGLKQLQREADELDARAAAPGFWDDMETAQKVSQKTAAIKGKIEAYQKLNDDYQDTLTLIELADEAEDLSLSNRRRHRRKIDGSPAACHPTFRRI